MPQSEIGTMLVESESPEAGSTSLKITKLFNRTFLEKGGEGIAYTHKNLWTGEEVTGSDTVLKTAKEGKGDLGIERETSLVNKIQMGKTTPVLGIRIQVRKISVITKEGKEEVGHFGEKYNLNLNSLLTKKKGGATRKGRLSIAFQFAFGG